MTKRNYEVPYLKVTVFLTESFIRTSGEPTDSATDDIGWQGLQQSAAPTDFD